VSCSTSRTFPRKPRVQVIVPSPLADAMRALLSGDASAQPTVDGDRVALEAGDRQAAGQRLNHDFPDYRRLARPSSGRGVLVDVAALRTAVQAARSARACAWTTNHRASAPPIVLARQLRAG